jgi:hypothetical protein
MRTCQECGNPLPPRKKKLCGRAECLRAYNRTRTREYFRNAGGNHYRKPEHAAKNRRDRWPDSNKAADQRRRARKLGVENESIRADVVFERDGWQCGICGGAVNPSLRYPHPMSASIDHVVQLAEGGPHLYSNVRCSHLDCNLRRPRISRAFQAEAS